MPWFRTDDTLHSHPKARRAGLPAMGLWVLAGSYSAQYTTEGFVPEWFISAWPQGRRHAATLIEAGLWYASEKDGEKGWQFHDWEHYQMTLEEVERDRELNRERQRRFREKRREARARSLGNDP